MYDSGKEDELEILDPQLEIIKRHKREAHNWQERRHDDWTENYTLYRGKVQVNRLTQRQSVNIPLIKTAIRTALKDIDDPPLLYFENLNNDKDTEIEYNEYFKEVARYNKLKLKDIVDKKQVFLSGRSFKKINIVNGRFCIDILDPYDVLVNRYTDPTNINSTYYLCHQHIFRPLSSLEYHEDYDKDALQSLKEYTATQAGIVKADSNLQTLTARNDRMRRLGVPDVDNPVLGETYIELNEHYIKKWDEELEEEVFYLITTAEDSFILCEKRLEDVIGETSDNFWRYNIPFTSWGDDLESADFWSDGMADTLRTPNKIINAWFSQLVENRTLRSFGMNFYDATIEGFDPQTFEPIPFGWYGLPGKPGDVYEKVDVPDLSDSLADIEFVMQVAEKASAATSIQQGVTEGRQITLGEVQLMMANATERVRSMSVFYLDDWNELGHKFVKMVEAAGDKLEDTTLYKKGLYSEQVYERRVKPSRFKNKGEWNVRVMSVSERQDETINALQKLNVAVQTMPDNAPLKDIYFKKVLELAELSPEEVKEVLDFERQKMESLTPEETMLGMNMQQAEVTPASPQSIPTQ